MGLSSLLIRSEYTEVYSKWLIWVCVPIESHTET